MTKAGVSPEVVRVYVQHAPAASAPTSGDLIALREQGVSDELSVALVTRAAELATKAGQTDPRTAPLRQSVTPPAATAGDSMDPESYGFWWYHYAYPRALASANERALSAYAPGSRFGPTYYGYYPAQPFRPQPPGRFLRLQ